MDFAQKDRCVYTALIGGYEQLNEQVVASKSEVPFICFTDDPNIASSDWEVRLIEPQFPSDPIRSQRHIKMHPHRYLAEYRHSLYIDNSIVLREKPEEIFDEFGGKAALALPRHSFRDSVLDEFIRVAFAGLDEPARIYEQLNHYTIENPAVLEQAPFWCGMLLRDHHDPKLVAAMEQWWAHFLRYARRDQLSINMVLERSGLVPHVIEIDNQHSRLHDWPVSGTRIRGLAGIRSPVISMMPANARLRELENEITKLRKYEAEAARLRPLEAEVASLRHLEAEVAGLRHLEAENASLREAVSQWEQARANAAASAEKNKKKKRSIRTSLKRLIGLEVTT